MICGYGVTFVNRARICLVSEIFHPEDQGGQGQQAFALARRLRESGAQVSVVTRRNFAASSRREQIDGIDIVRLPPVGLFKGRGWMAVLPTLRFLMALFIHLVRTSRHYDVILLQGVKAIIVPPLLVGWMMSKPCVLKIDAHAELDQDVSAESLGRMKLPGLGALVGLWGRLRLALLRRASVIIAISAQIEAALTDKLGGKVRVLRIPNGLDLERWRVAPAPRAELRQRLHLPEGIIVTYTGRLSRAKGLPNLLQAWQRIATRHPQAHLVLVGSGERSPDNCEQELREFVDAWNLRERVTFAGHADDVSAYLHASDLFVQSSDSEGFGLALAEAMAAGLPCVTTAVGVAPEIVDDRTGWLIPPQNRKALEQALESALQQRDRWPAMSAAAREQVRAFEMEEVARRYQTVFDEACAEAPAKGLIAKGNVRWNAAWLLGCRIGADLLNFVLFLIVTNVFGPSGMGVYAYGFAIAGFVYAATTLGIDEYGIREYVRRDPHERRRLISDLLGAQLLVAAIAFGVLAGFLYTTAATREVVTIVAALSAYQLCAAVSNTLFVPSMGEQRMMKPALIVLASRALAFVAAGALIWLADADIATAMLPFAVSGVVMLAMAARSARSFGSTLTPHVSKHAMRDAGRNLWSFAAVDIMGQLFTRIAVIALVLWVSEHAAGIYAAGLKLAEVACMPLLFLGQAAYPALSRAFAQREEFRRFSRQALLWGSFVAVVIAAAMALLVPVLLVPLLGQGYAGTEPIIAAMASLVLVQGIEIVAGRLLLAANRSVARAVWVTSGAAICAISTAWLVPKFGIVAAIATTTAAYLLVDAMYLRSLLPFLRNTPPATLDMEGAQRTKVAA